MIKVYARGNDFYDDNRDFLLTNPYTEFFFRLDAPLLTETNKEEYAIKVFNDEKTLLVLEKEPYDVLFFGDKELIGELIDYLITNSYKLNSFLCPLELGEEISSYLKDKGINFKLDLGMDFMVCREKSLPSSALVEHASSDDLDAIYENVLAFIKDCGLKDKVTKEKVAKNLQYYRIIRVGNEIAAMASFYVATKDDMKITNVYTKNKYRGKGFAKLICTSILNEIIDSGKYATLNVDIKNPVSYHIYSSIGFKRVFSQGIFGKE